MINNHSVASIHRTILGLACILLLGTVSPNSYADDVDLTQIRSQIKELRQDVDKTRQQRKNAQEKLKALEKRIGSLYKKQQQTEQQQQQISQQLKKLQQQQAASQQRLNNHSNSLKKLSQLRHQQGPQGQLKLLFDQQDISTLGRNSQYLQYFNKAQLETINALDKELNNLKQLKQQDLQRQKELNGVRKRLAQQETELNDEQKKRRLLISSITKKLQSKESRLNQLLEDAKRLKQVVKHIEEKVSPSSHTKFSKLRGKLPWPAKGKLTAKFGQSRNLGKLTWEGIVISAPLGNNVRAVADGVVVFSDWLRGYGLLTIIDHGQGYLSLYGQNLSLNKEVGDKVKKNEVIAAIGNTGGGNKPGLYFELRKQGKPVNPRRWCKGSHPS